MTYAAAPQVIETDVFNQQGQLVEEIFQVQQPVMTMPRDLLAMGVVVSERVISIDELAAEGRYAEADAVAAP